jgi:hypothetical protein
MEKELLGKLVISLFYLKYLIMPIGVGIISFINIFKIKHKIEKAGRNYCNRSDLKIKNFHLLILIFAIIFLLITLIILIVSSQWFASAICLSFILWIISIILSNRIYGNISGIYENGIIDADKRFRVWGEIHSYKISSNNISGYFNYGNIFEYNNLENINEIKELFEKYKILDREKL